MFHDFRHNILNKYQEKELCRLCNNCVVTWLRARIEEGEGVDVWGEEGLEDKPWYVEETVRMKKLDVYSRIIGLERLNERPLFDPHECKFDPNDYRD